MKNIEPAEYSRGNKNYINLFYFKISWFSDFGSFCALYSRFWFFLCTLQPSSYPPVDWDILKEMSFKCGSRCRIEVVCILWKMRFYFVWILTGFMNYVSLLSSSVSLPCGVNMATHFSVSMHHYRNCIWVIYLALFCCLKVQRTWINERDVENNLTRIYLLLFGFVYVCIRIFFVPAVLSQLHMHFTCIKLEIFKTIM